MDDDDRTRLLIKEGKFPYKFKGQGDRDQPFGDAKYMWSHIDPKVKELFWETLHRDGRRYTDRPTVQEWTEVFLAYKRNMVSKARWQDPMSDDVYPIRYKAYSKDVTITDCPRCGWRYGIAGWLDENGGPQRVPAQCNRCASKCQGCGDPDQFGTFRDGLCRVCRDDEKTATPTVTSRATHLRETHPRTTPPRAGARPSGTRGPVRTSTPPSARPPIARPAPARPSSAWERFINWLGL
jgi:hypothetical protein